LLANSDQRKPDEYNEKRGWAVGHKVIEVPGEERAPISK